MASSGGSDKKSKKSFWTKFKGKGPQLASNAPIHVIETHASLLEPTTTYLLNEESNTNPEESASSKIHSNVAEEEADDSVAPSKIQSNAFGEGLGIAGRFVQTLLKKLPDCVDNNPVKMALSIVKTIIEVKDDIRDTKGSLGEGLQKTKSLLDELTITLGGTALEDFKQEMETFRTVIESEKGKLLNMTEKLKSCVQILDYESYRKDIEDICKAIDLATELFILKMQLNIRKTTTHIHDEIKKASLNELNPSRKADFKTVLEKQILKREVCADGTRMNVLEELTHWANDHTTDSPQVFWLTGQAGSGKTTIAYTIAKLFDRGQPTILAATFLCSRQFEESRSLNRILPTLAYQLAHKCEPYMSTLHVHVTNKSAVVDYDLSEQMYELLVKPWQEALAHRPRYLLNYLVIVDALDEVSEDGGIQFLELLLTTINEKAFVGLKFLVTSRPDPRVVELVKPCKSMAVFRLQDMPFEDADADIERYLNTKLPNIAGSPEIVKLRLQAEGLFIYAATAVRILTSPQFITHKERMRRLENIISDSSAISSTGKDSSPIDKLYQQILCEAFSGYTGRELQARLQILFTFLCAAERITTSVAEILMDDDAELSKAVFNSLSSVLYIQDNRVFWYHGSFLDFLFSKTRACFCVGNQEYNFWCNKDAHHVLLARSCFSVMKSGNGLRFNIADIPSSYLLDIEHIDQISEMVNKNISPILKYSLLNWTHHLFPNQHQDSLSDLICGDMSDFLQLHVLFWIEAMHLFGLSHQCTPMLYQVRRWVLNSQDIEYYKHALARDLLECANFATHFTGSPAAKSTPHLYISALATWEDKSDLSKKWKTQFMRIPAFTHAKGRRYLPLLSIHTAEWALTVTFSKDGTQIASGSNDQCVRIWNASTGKEQQVLRGHSDTVNSVSFSNDNKWIASGSNDLTLRVWNVTTGDCLQELRGHTNAVSSVAISRNDSWIASGSFDCSIRLWDVSTGITLKVMIGHTNWINSIAFSGNNAFLASGSYDNFVRVWDTSNGSEVRILKGHTSVVTSVAFSFDNHQIVSGSWDDTIRIWSASTGEQLRILRGHSSWVNSVSFSQNGAWIVSGSKDRSVQLWDGLTGELLKVFKGHTDNIHSVAFSTDASRVLSGSEDRSVKMWSVSSQPDTTDVVDNNTPITAITWSGNGTRIVFSSNDGSVCVWDATIYRELGVFKADQHCVNALACSHDGARIAWVSEDKVWVKDTLRNTPIYVLQGHTQQVNCIGFSRDGRLLVSTSSDDTTRIWDLSKGIQLMEINAVATFVVFSQNGRQVVTGSYGSSSIDVWNIFPEDPLHLGPTGVEDHQSARWITLSSDATKIISGGNQTELGTVKVQDISTGLTMKILRGHTRMVYTVAISRDGAHVVSGSFDNTIRVWDVSTGKEITPLRGYHMDSVKSVVISADGTSFISGSRDGSVIIWNMDIPAWNLDPEGSGWILSPTTNCRLMWAPPDAHVLPRPNCRLLAGDAIYSSVNFDECAIGAHWSQCYTTLC